MTLVAIQIAATHRSTVTNCNIFLHLSRYTRLCVLYYALCAIYSVHIIVRPRVDVDNIISHCMHHCCNMLWCSTTHFDGSIYFSSLTTATVPSDSVLMFWRKCFSWTLPSGGGCGFGWALPLTVKRHHRWLIAQLMFMFMFYMWTPRSFRFFLYSVIAANAMAMTALKRFAELGLPSSESLWLWPHTDSFIISLCEGRCDRVTRTISVLAGPFTAESSTGIMHAQHSRSSSRPSACVALSKYTGVTMQQKQQQIINHKMKIKNKKSRRRNIWPLCVIVREIYFYATRFFLDYFHCLCIYFLLAPRIIHDRDFCYWCLTPTIIPIVF